MNKIEVQDLTEGAATPRSLQMKVMSPSSGAIETSFAVVDVSEVQRGSVERIVRLKAGTVAALKQWKDVSTVLYIEPPTFTSEETLRGYPGRNLWVRSASALQEAPSLGGWVHHPNLHEDVEASLRATPIEDGVTHPAEELLRSALKNSPDTQQWMQQLYRRWQKDPEYAAALIRCLGRLHRVLTEPAGPALILRALQSPDLIVRDAAVVAIEQWEAIDLAKSLEPSRERVAWLAEHMRQVIDDLGG